MWGCGVLALSANGGCQNSIVMESVSLWLIRSLNDGDGGGVVGDGGGVGHREI